MRIFNVRTYLSFLVFCFSFIILAYVYTWLDVGIQKGLLCVFGDWAKKKGGGGGGKTSVKMEVVKVWRRFLIILNTKYIVPTTTLAKHLLHVDLRSGFKV